MTIASQSAGFPSAALRRLATGLVLAAALAGLSACSAYDQVFGDEPVPGIVTTGSGAQQDTVVPSLASVPDRPVASTAAQRQALQESLRQDRSRAVYSDQPAASASTSMSSSGMSSTTMSSGSMNSGSMNSGSMSSGSGTAAAMTQEVARPSLPEAPDGRAQSSIETQDRIEAQAPMRVLPSAPALAPSSPATSSPAPAVGPTTIAQYNLPQRPNYSELVGVIFFGYGSSSLDSRDVGVLRQIVQMQQQRGGRLRIVGHAPLRTGVTDPVKHNLANFNMSLQRAQTVAGRLEALGAPPVVVEAMGSAQPVYYEFMPTGEAGNRRAEVFLDY